MTLQLVATGSETLETCCMDVAERFHAHETIRGYSPRTIRRRTQTLRRFSEQCDPATATSADVEAFIAGHRSPETRRGYLNDLRRFYRWATRQGLLEHDPTATIETIRVPRRSPTPLSPESVARLRLACETNQERLTVELGLCAGLRCAEMAALHSDDVDIVNRVIAVRNGKGGKDRTVPLSSTLAPLLTMTGTVLTVNSSDACSNRLRNVLRRAGLGHHRPHDLRATFATELARASNGNVSLVATLLGHSSLVTTQRYVSFNPLGGEYVDRLHVA